MNVKSLFRGFFLWVSVVFFSILTASSILIAYPIVVLFDRQRHLLHSMASFCFILITWCNPWWKFTIHGRKHLAKNGKAVVYVANHQSQVDILAAFILNTRFRWIGKLSAFRVPLIGWGMYAVGYVPVKRGNKASGERSMELSAEHIKNGIPMFFFPEGTRSKDGVLGEFKSGAFRLAKKFNVPIVPISLLGCNNLLPKGSIVPRSASVQVYIHSLIEPENLTVDELVAQARTAIASKL